MSSMLTSAALTLLMAAAPATGGSAAPQPAPAVPTTQIVSAGATRAADLQWIGPYTEEWDCRIDEKWLDGRLNARVVRECKRHDDGKFWLRVEWLH